jgi:hypothetical protein
MGTGDGVNLFNYTHLRARQPKSCSPMSVFKLADDHPLTKAGLHCSRLVKTAEQGLRVGDVVFEFSFGRIVDTGMACGRDGIIPPGLDLLDVHKQAAAARGACKVQPEEVRRTIVLPFRRAG